MFSEVSVFSRDRLFSRNSPAILPLHYSRALELGLADSGRRSWRLFSPHERLGHEFSCY